MNNNKLHIYLEKNKGRVLVGMLESSKKGYVFTYDESYYYSDNPMQIGPNLPLSKQTHSSKKLFGIFKDRLPSRQNEAYLDYCRQEGISADETNEMILLATLGKRGPSSFIIEPIIDSTINPSILAEFRKKMELSMRDFAILFDLSLSSVHKIENSKMNGKDVLKRIQIYIDFPIVAKNEVSKHLAKVHSTVGTRVMNKLDGEIRKVS